jgi:hypothetical protein
MDKHAKHLSIPSLERCVKLVFDELYPSAKCYHEDIHKFLR